MIMAHGTEPSWRCPGCPSDRVRPLRRIGAHTSTILRRTIMNRGIGLFVYPVKDIARAKTLFTKLLATEPYADKPYYVGFRVGDQEIGLDPNGHKAGLTGPI